MYDIKSLNIWKASSRKDILKGFNKVLSIDVSIRKEICMDSLMNDRTTFIIAHRLSTVRNSDAIMVLELGRIIERGNHESLIAKSGRYYQLYTGAFELE